MDYQELETMALRARSETEAFINTNLQDHRKKWPRNCRSQIFTEDTDKIPCMPGHRSYESITAPGDCNFDTQILNALS